MKKNFFSDLDWESFGKSVAKDPILRTKATVDGE